MSDDALVDALARAVREATTGDPANRACLPGGDDKWDGYVFGVEEAIGAARSFLTDEGRGDARLVPATERRPDHPEAVCSECAGPKGLHAIGESCNSNCGGKVVRWEQAPERVRGKWAQAAADEARAERDALRESADEWQSMWQAAVQRIDALEAERDALRRESAENQAAWIAAAAEQDALAAENERLQGACVRSLGRAECDGSGGFGPPKDSGLLGWTACPGCRRCERVRVVADLREKVEAYDSGSALMPGLLRRKDVLALLDETTKEPRA